METKLNQETITNAKFSRMNYSTKKLGNILKCICKTITKTWTEVAKEVLAFLQNR